MKNNKKNIAVTMGFDPIKAQNNVTKNDPKCTVLKTGKDMRVKAGK